MPGSKGIQPRVQIEMDVFYVLRAIGATWEAPTATDLAFLEKAETRMAEATAELDRLFDEKVGPIREQFAASGLALLHDPEV